MADAKMAAATVTPASRPATLAEQAYVICVELKTVNAPVDDKGETVMRPVTEVVLKTEAGELPAAELRMRVRGNAKVEPGKRYRLAVVAE